MKDSNGNTPLHLAVNAIHGQDAIAAELITALVAAGMYLDLFSAFPLNTKRRSGFTRNRCACRC